MIYFIRHGETDYNKACRLQGQLDIPLNENGIAQAEKARDELANFHFDIIYSSSLVRAKKTAEIVNEKHNVQIVYEDRLKEINGGEMQGKCLKDWTSEMHEDFNKNRKNLGAETVEQFCERVESFYKEIENSNKDILIVAHGGVYRAIYKYINNIKDFNFELKGLKNASVIVIK